MAGFGDRALRLATRGTVAVPSALAKPAAGSVQYRCYTMIRDGRGAMEAPDGNLLYFRLVDGAGNVTALESLLVTDSVGGTPSTDSADAVNFTSVTGWNQVAGIAATTGEIEFYLKVNSGAGLPTAEDTITVETGWYENGVLGKETARIRVTDEAADIEDVLTDTADKQPRLALV